MKVIYEDNEQIGRFLKDIMKQNNIRQVDIVNKTGLTKQTVSNIFKKENITLEDINIICNTVDCQFSLEIIDNITELCYFRVT